MNCKPVIHIKYYLLQALYWMEYCATISYSAYFLQSRGFSNTGLGVVMANGYIVGFISSIFLASFVDRRRRLYIVYKVLFAALGIQVCLLFLVASRDYNTYLLGVFYSLIIAMEMIENPINTVLCVEIEKKNYVINYGRARSIGSIAYVPTAILIGRTVNMFSSVFLPLISGAICVLRIVILLLIMKSVYDSADFEKTDKALQDSNDISILIFLKRYNKFCFMLFGCGIVFIAHNSTTDFMVNLVKYLNGSTKTLGNINAFRALCEIPVMFFGTGIMKKCNASKLLRFCIIMFVVKSICISLSENIPQLFAAHTFQALSFAVYTPTIVRYTSEVVAHEDSAKGQALAGGVVTFGLIFSNLLGGILYDRFGVNHTLLIFDGIALIGALIAIPCMQNKKNNKSNTAIY